MWLYFRLHYCRCILLRRLLKQVSEFCAVQGRHHSKSSFNSMRPKKVFDLTTVNREKYFVSELPWSRIVVPGYIQFRYQIWVLRTREFSAGPRCLYFLLNIDEVESYSELILLEQEGKMIFTGGIVSQNRPRVLGKFLRQIFGHWIHQFKSLKI
jgi:hypothetical protein